MKNFFNRVRGGWEVGGLNLLLFKLEDKIFKKKEANNYIKRIVLNTREEDYKELIEQLYLMHTGRNMSLENPVTFNEKIQWLKCYDSTALKTRLADKILVREWISEKIGDTYLIPLIGVYDKFEDIKFDSLPDQFALKANHGSGMNIIVKNKNIIDYESVKKEANSWLNTIYGLEGMEIHYKNIHRKLLIEQYIEEMDGNLMDYKIHCFNGQPKLIHMIGNRNLESHTGAEAFYDIDWKIKEYTSKTYAKYDKKIDKPKELNQLLEIAKILSEEFIYVRVDLYVINGKIYFGELTFTPGAGYYSWSKEYDEIVGAYLTLPSPLN